MFPPRSIPSVRLAQNEFGAKLFKTWQHKFHCSNCIYLHFRTYVQATMFLYTQKLHKCRKACRQHQSDTRSKRFKSQSSEPKLGAYCLPSLPSVTVGWHVHAHAAPSLPVPLHMQQTMLGLPRTYVLKRNPGIAQLFRRYFHYHATITRRYATPRHTERKCKVTSSSAMAE